MDDDFYALLEVEEDASQDEIKTAFREKVQEYHPDHNDDPRAPAQFTALKKAYDTLGDPVERNAYDRMGHRDYVSKRLDGLPDPEKWAPSKVDDDDDSDTTSTTESATTGGKASSSTRSTAGSTRSSGTRSSRSSGSSTASSSTASASTGTGSTGRSSGTTGSSTGTASETSSTTSGSMGAGSQATATNGGSTAGASTAGRSAGSGASARTASDGAGAATRRDAVSAWIANNAVARRLVGWPLLWFAVLLYGAGLGAFGYRHAGAVTALADRVAAAGTDPAALRAAVGREGLPVLFEFVAATLSSSATAPPVAVGAAALVGLGAVLLPAITFLLVYLTRGSPGWKPTYLYVVATLGPLAAVGAGSATALPLAAELALAAALPALGLFVMLLSAFVRPKLLALVR